MRIVLILLVCIYFQLNGQDKNKVALTAGSEFLDKNNEQNKSITMTETVICPFDVITRPKNEFIAQLPQSVEVVSSQKTNPILYLVIILLIGFAIHFFLAKKETDFNSQIAFEEEEEQARKKELWKAMSEPETGE
jgi:hypothetical protein